jgi:hypothetical protein
LSQLPQPSRHAFETRTCTWNPSCAASLDESSSSARNGVIQAAGFKTAHGIVAITANGISTATGLRTVLAQVGITGTGVFVATGGFFLLLTPPFRTAYAESGAGTTYTPSATAAELADSRTRST